MGKNKRNRKRARRARERRREAAVEMEGIELGSGDYMVLTIPRGGGAPVAQRFETHGGEALAEHRKHVCGDDPPSSR